MTTTTENIYSGDGSTVLYSFTFPYINESDVKVSLNGLDVSTYSLANATTVEFDTAPATGVTIRIYRVTPLDSVSAEFYPGSAIRAQDLNGNFEQTLFIVQESQTIIENSDAASVVGIANEALTTANQASATANAISGTADEALTTATTADAKATQAGLDAAAANTTAVAARVVADAALNPGSVVSDLADVSTTSPNTNQVLAWSGSEWAPVNQSGGGGGGETINYSGASAWGHIGVNQEILGGLNIADASTDGVYRTVTFATPMPDANYSVVGSVINTSAVMVFTVYSQTPTGFQYFTNALSSVQNVNTECMFQVFATNALPPLGGTGTDAWGSVQSDGTLDASFNISSVNRIGTGQYQVTFTTPMPTDKYSVTLGAQLLNIMAANYSAKTTTGFKVFIHNIGGGSSVLTDSAFNFQVNATNATLPLTFDSEQIKAAINNPGASAWGKTAADGTFLNGLNISSVTRSVSGNFVTYDYVFATPMPNANYSVVVTGDSTTEDMNVIQRVLNVSATGFSVNFNNPGGSASSSITHSFTVFATNALPPKGGTGTDAWGAVDLNSAVGPSNVTASFNVASVTRPQIGYYDVVFTTPMPTDNYAVTASVVGGATLPGQYYTTCYNRTTTGFSVGIVNSNANTYADQPFDFQVNATDATLPTTFTEAQIQSVLDFIAVANPAGIAKAWGSVQLDGTISSSLNVASVTRTANGQFSVVFATPMPNADYSLQLTVDGTTRAKMINYELVTANGFRAEIVDYSNGLENAPFSFTVHSN